MVFVPKKSKYKKQFKGKSFNQIYKNINSNVFFTGSIALKALECGTISSKMFEAIKQSIKKIIKKAGCVIFLVFPQTPKSKKPLEIRMGKGKGNIDHWICKIQTGVIICEVITKNEALGIKALTTARFRLPLKTKLVFEK